MSPVATNNSNSNSSKNGPNKRKSQKLVTYGRSKRLRQVAADMFAPSNEHTNWDQTPPTVPPRPPRSQKEATMALTNVLPADIQTVVEFTGCSRDDAERYLRVKRNDIQQAVGAIFDGEDISKEEAGMTWDESAWGKDREGDTRDNTGDQHLHPLGTATAPPSRAPSRNSMRPTNQQDEDAQLQEALAMSKQDPSFQQQESGRIGQDGKESQFGPATRAQYDESSWGLIRTTHPREVVPDVPIEQCKHEPGQPRFLKHMSPDGDYLPNLLTICHGIAKVREVMLMRERVQASYGEDGEWWKGHAIAMPRIVHTESGQPVNVDAENTDTFLGELQRLMTFLDCSERTYATVLSLTDTQLLKEVTSDRTRPHTLTGSFLEAWNSAARVLPDSDEKTKMLELFRTKLSSNNHQGYANMIDLSPVLMTDEKADLGELLDGYFWGTDGNASLGKGEIAGDPADVLVLRLKNKALQAQKLAVDITPEIHMDKYLQTNSSATAELRSNMAEGRSRIKKIEAIEKKLTLWKHPKQDKQIDPRLLLKHSQGVFSGENKVDADAGGLPNGVAVDIDLPPHYEDIARKLEETISSIDKKLETLALEREKTRKAIADMSRNPLPSLPGQLKHRYTLRGVATKANISYILLPKEEEDEDLLMDERQDDDSTPEGMQWWRIAYEVNAAGTEGQISMNKTPDYDVIRAAELEHDSALLVYANDRANDIEQVDPSLPQPLLDFVNRDNALFRSDLQDAVRFTQPPAYHIEGGMDDVRPSIERSLPHNISSDSLQALDGNPDDHELDPPGYDQDGFMAHPGFGLGPGHKGDDFDPPVDEIRLAGGDDQEEEEGDAVESREMEMMDSYKSLVPSVSGGGPDGTGNDRDVPMEGAESQQAR
ncbi:hypothetical protein LTR78_003792 [Recurvomyces mirabilis]|uniref:Uncharacterized protein n=1 Tax=Recurvomyces mirabilis TaxID=574656 RepID=A0AAE0WRD7_9PEZI|nr:hypothetical protein LTR78_003792 [Recurvomyces mirabilis]KAK5154904.1 hypothetical protein LTS14_006485 [Recurvomyces mirabilis]